MGGPMTYAKLIETNDHQPDVSGAERALFERALRYREEHTQRASSYDEFKAKGVETADFTFKVE